MSLYVMLKRSLEFPMCTCMFRIRSVTTSSQGSRELGETDFFVRTKTNNKMFTTSWNHTFLDPVYSRLNNAHSQNYKTESHECTVRVPESSQNSLRRNMQHAHFICLGNNKLRPIVGFLQKTFRQGVGGKCNAASDAVVEVSVATENYVSDNLF